jgi:signal transduction histidine kinase
MSVELELELRNLKAGDHACALFDSAGCGDDWATIVPFFKEGLSRGERCQLMVDDAEQRRVAMQVLSEAGVDSELEVQRGALTFFEQGPQMFARFNPRVQLRALEVAVSQSLAGGFSGVRFCGASPYSPPGAVVDERAWLEFEALMSDASRRWKVITICRHDLRRSRPSFLREILRVHPKAVLGPLVFPCTYYEPPKMVLGQVSDEERLRWMIDQLCSARIAQRVLEHAVRARDEFLSAASHELRTPLTTTLLDLDHLVRGTDRAPEHVAKSSVMPGLRRLRQNFRRFVDVVQRLIDASQLREDLIEFRLEPVDLAEVTRSALDHSKDVLRRSHCDVTLVAPDESIVGRWDRMRLEQVVANLVENAAKFGECKPIEVTVSRSDGTARLVVHDHGIGIRSEDMPRIFDRFERGVPASHYGGFGLGLWIACTIVEAFDGHIFVDSTPGSGTTVAVDLPLAAKEPPSFSPEI